jgi:hypothetical protein
MSLPGINPRLACWVDLAGLSSSYAKHVHTALSKYLSTPRGIDLAIDHSYVAVYLSDGEVDVEGAHAYVYQNVVNVVTRIGVDVTRVQRPSEARTQK